MKMQEGSLLFLWKKMVLFGYVNSTCQQYLALLCDDLRPPMHLFGVRQPQPALQNVEQFSDQNYRKEISKTNSDTGV